MAEDGVRQCFIDALARRAQAHEGPVRQLLEARLDALRAEPLAPAVDSAVAPAGPGPLAELVEHIARHAPAADPTATELKTAHYFRSTWSRLSAEKRLTQSLASVPPNAGPLNSQQLVHRALLLMRELSPAYLERFMSQVDTLLWLEEAGRPPAGRMR
jgi:hypothetical protein